jgi:hypothetical protein
MLNAKSLSALLLAAAIATGCTVTSNGSGADAGTGDGDGGASGADGGLDPATCGFGEPNDTREQGTPIEVNKSYAGCVSSPDGQDLLDFYEFTAPSDAAGGYVEVTVSNVGATGLAELIVTSSADNDLIFDAYTTDSGASVKGWLTVAPGAKYRARVSRFAGAGPRFSYSLEAKYTKIQDAFEPNNDKASAKPLTLGTAIQASAAAVSANTALATGDDQDWYKVTLAAGTATVKLENSPADYLCDVELIDDAGTGVAEKYTTDKGANCQVDAMSLTGGTYYVKVHSFGGLPIRGAANTAPAAFVTGQYTLTVSQ